ncbi:MAG: outer membrane beta-barrel protein [Bacteroidota bacterium]
MKNKQIVWLTFFCLAAICSKAQWSLGAFSGYLVPIGYTAQEVNLNRLSRESDYRTFSKGIIPIGLSLKCKLGKRFMLSGDYCTTTINMDDSYIVNVNGESYKSTFTNTLQYYSLGANYLFAKNINYSKWVPLLGINIGIYSSALTTTMAKNNGEAYTVSFDSKNRWAVGTKMGVRYTLSSEIHAEAAIRYNYIFTSEFVKSNNKGNPPLSFNNSQLVGVELGVNFDF